MVEFRANVRTATKSDFPDIVSHYGSDGGSPLIPFSSAERIKCIPIEGLLVAEVDEKYAGFLYWFSGREPLHDFGVTKYGYISEVRIVKEFYDKNVGLALLNEAFRRMEKGGLYTIYTHLNEGNKALIRLYEDLNFTAYSRTLHLRLTNPEIGPIPRERTHNENREIAVYMVELKEQCRSLLIAYNELDELFNEVPQSDMDSRRVLNSRIWSRLQAIMYSASVISKLLWPNPLPRKDGADKRAILRARVLRKALGIERMRSILPTDVRNALEHVDERLIDWLPGQPEDIPWGWRLSGFEKDEEPPGSEYAFRYYNLNTQELRVGDSRCNLKEVVKFVGEIENHIWPEAQVHFEDKGVWDPIEKKWKK